MDIQNAARPLFRKVLAQNAQKAREDDDIDLVLLEQQLDGRLKVVLNEARRC